MSMQPFTCASSDAPEDPTLHGRGRNSQTPNLRHTETGGTLNTREVQFKNEEWAESRLKGQTGLNTDLPVQPFITRARLLALTIVICISAQKCKSGRFKLTSEINQQPSSAPSHRTHLLSEAGEELNYSPL